MYQPLVSLLVKMRTAGTVDRFGNETFVYAEPITVEGCLFAPGSTSDLGTDRPEGVTISATAHFPKDFEGDLQDALISQDGKRWLKVVGKPIAFPPGTVPGRWDMSVSLSDTDG